MPFAPRSISPHAQLLPYLEQAAVYSRINFAETGIYPLLTAPSSALNEELLGLTIPVYLCPSDTPKPGANNYRANMGIAPSPVAQAGNSQELVTSRKRFGAFRSGMKGLSPASFTDGLACTIVFSEKLIGAGTPAKFVPWRDYFVTSAPMASMTEVEAACLAPASINPPHDAFSGTTWLFGGFAQTWYNHLLGPNSQVPDCGAVGVVSGPGSYAARSFHPGGVNVGFASGSAQFLNDSVELRVWRALATRAGGESIDVNF